MLSIDEVADQLAVSRDTIRRLVERGELKAVKVGAQWRISTADLAAYLERNTPEPVVSSGG
jgi:excisionase family DNA binding protein